MKIFGEKIDPDQEKELKKEFSNFLIKLVGESIRDRLIRAAIVGAVATASSYVTEEPKTGTPAAIVRH